MYQTLIKIRDLLKESLKGKVKYFFIDDPNLIPQGALPCLAITPVSTDTDIADTGRDIHTRTIDIFLIINAKDELNKFGKEMVGTQFLCDIMEGEDENGNLKDYTVLYTLRKNLNLGNNWMIQNISAVDYGLRSRPEQGITKEASIRITVARISNRPS